MTCRKELADECERHYKEEQKLIKSSKQLKQQIDQSNEKLEKSAIATFRSISLCFNDSFAFQAQQSAERETARGEKVGKAIKV